MWPDGGRSFEVHRTSDHQCLTMDGAFDLAQIEHLFGTIACQGVLGWIGDCCAASRAEIDEVAR